MEWLNLHASTLRSEACMDATHEQRSVWLLLLSFCIQQENGGTIEGIAEWSDTKCIRMIGASRSEIADDCPLWEWDGQDLNVHFYPKEREKAVRQNRKNGRAAIAARWSKTPSKTPTAIPTALPDGIPTGIPSGTPDPNSDGIPTGIPNENTERKGKEGEKKGRECVPPTPNGVSDPGAHTDFAESPSLAEVETFAASWPGEPASATPRFDPEWIRDWFEFRSNSRTAGFEAVREWRRLLVADWRKQHAGWPAKKAARQHQAPVVRGIATAFPTEAPIPGMKVKVL